MDNLTRRRSSLFRNKEDNVDKSEYRPNYPKEYVAKLNDESKEWSKILDEHNNWKKELQKIPDIKNINDSFLDKDQQDFLNSVDIFKDNVKKDLTEISQTIVLRTEKFKTLEESTTRLLKETKEKLLEEISKQF